MAKKPTIRNSDQDLVVESESAGAEAQPIEIVQPVAESTPDPAPVVTQPSLDPEVEDVQPGAPTVKDESINVAADKRRYWIDLKTTQIGHGQEVYPVIRTLGGSHWGYVDLPKGASWYEDLVQAGSLIKA